MRARLDPGGGFQTSALDRETVSGSACMAGYSPCLPTTDDLDCGDVRSLGKAPVVVTGNDPYRLDGDDDGYACE